MNRPVAASLKMVGKRLTAGVVFVVCLLVFVALVLTGTEAGSSWLIKRSLQLAGSSAGLNISVDETSGSFFDELLLRNVVISGDDGLQVSARLLATTMNPLALFDRTVDIRRLAISNLHVSVPPGDEDPGEEQMSLDLEPVLDSLFGLPLTIRLLEIELVDLRVTANSTLRLERVAGSFHLDNTTAALRLELDADGQSALDADLQLTANGRQIQGDLNWRSTAGENLLTGALGLSGDLSEISLIHTLTAPVEVESRGVIRPGLSGAGGEPEEELPAFNLQHTVTGLRGVTLGIPQLESMTASLVTAGSWQAVNINGSGEAVISGLGRVQADLSADLFEGQVTVNTAQLRGRQLGSLTVSGNAGLGEELFANLDYRLEGFADGDLVASVELESMDSRGSLTLNRIREDAVMQVRIDSLTGVLNGYALTGRGDLSLQNDEVREVFLDLASGSNTLLIEGGVSPELLLVWELEAPALHQIVQGVSGGISGRGSLNGSVDAPQIDGDFTVENLTWSGNGSHLTLKSADIGAIHADASNTVTLEFEGLEAVSSAGSFVQESGTLRFSGSPQAHTIQISTRSPALSLEVAANGGLKEAVWEGILERVQIDSKYGLWNLQEAVALAAGQENISVGDHCWAADPILVCGEGIWNDDGVGEGIEGSLTIDNLPLAYFNDKLPSDIESLSSVYQTLAGRPPGIGRQLQAYAVAMPENSYIDGALDISVQFSGPGPDWRQAQITAELAPREVVLGILRTTSSDAEPQTLVPETYGFDEVSLSVLRRENRWSVNSGFEVYLAEQGGLDFQGTFAGSFNLGDDNTLGGDFDLAFNNIAWVEALAPVFKNVDGELGASGSVTGSIERPIFLVEAVLNESRFEIPEYGMQLEAVNLVFNSDENNAMSLNGSARSGDGMLMINSSMTRPFMESREIHFTLAGEKVLLMDLPESRVVVEPDLAMAFEAGILSISGSIGVPEMKLDFSERQVSSNGNSVQVSRDAVIVAVPEGERLRASSASELIARIPVIGDVSLAMGNDVHFAGLGLDLDLTGSLALEQALNRPLLAHGELTIPTGSYSLYGQTLAIENGKLLFLGNPMNPALDIRATRRTSEAEVGLLLNGTASNIQAQLFSSPALPESEILSLLVTGRSFRHGEGLGQQDGENMLGAIALLSLEKGQGLTDSVSNKLGLDTVAITSGTDYRDSALGLGKYLSPNLFMRYDIGLFDRENTLTLDYILTQRLKLEVETGVSQSVDLTYTVEK